MGQAKQLLPLGEKTAVSCCAESILLSGIRDVIVVTGRDDKGIRDTLRGLPVQFANNNCPESDMAQSVRIALSMIDRDSMGVLVCLADHPLVQPETIRTLLQKHLEAAESIIVPCFQGRRGHPSLFPSVLIREIFSAPSMREIISRNAERVLQVDVPDEGVVLDMDTDDDYRRVLERLRGSRVIRH